MRQLRYLYIRRPARKRQVTAEEQTTERKHETVADIDFGKEFPFVLNPYNPDAPGTISLAPERSAVRINHAPSTRKPVNGRASACGNFQKTDFALFGFCAGACFFSFLLCFLGWVM